MYKNMYKMCRIFMLKKRKKEKRKVSGAYSAASAGHISRYEILIWPPSVTSNKLTSVHISHFLASLPSIPASISPSFYLFKRFYNNISFSISQRMEWFDINLNRRQINWCRSTHIWATSDSPRVRARPSGLWRTRTQIDTHTPIVHL